MIKGIRKLYGQIDRLLQAACRILPKPLLDLVVRWHRMLTYGFMGCINTAVDFLVFVLLYRLAGLPIELSQAAGFISGSAHGYFLNSNTTFTEGRGRTKGQFFQYVGVDVVLTLCSSFYMGWMENGRLPVMLTKLIVTVATGILHYIIYKLLVFRIRKDDKEEKND